MKKYYLIILFCIIVVENIFADWDNPKVIINMKWGAEIGQVGLSYGDPDDIFPSHIVINMKGEIILTDWPNERFYLFSSDNKIINIFSKNNFQSNIEFLPLFIGMLEEKLLFRYNDKYLLYNYKGNLINSFYGLISNDTYVIDENYFIVKSMKDKRYYSYNSSGKNFKIYDSKPLELGVVKEENLGNGKYESTVTFPDYTYKVSTAIGNYSRDILGNFYNILYQAKKLGNKVDSVIIYRVIRVDRCTGVEYVFEPPHSEYGDFIPETIDSPAPKRELKIEYGEPIVSPLGDLYCWARTKTEYKILKWTWQGPEDAPQSLKISSGVAGLKLNWAKPVKDVETVTGYQILRSVEVCGPFNEVVMVKKDKLAFEDTTIKPPWKYYYVVKAVRDKKFSGESNKVYMQWK